MISVLLACALEMQCADPSDVKATYLVDCVTCAALTALPGLCFSNDADPAAVKAAYLLDPVDELSSSAVQQLAGRGLALGVTAAGITGAFNPERSNYRVSNQWQW